MRFDKIMIIGSGKIACDCVRYLLTIVNKEKLIVLEQAGNSLSMLKKLCESQKIVCMMCDKEEINICILNQIKEQSTLIVSANNRFIFTPEIINFTGTEIINFHYALLPHYRGMNIPTWVIFNREKQTGITWHYVTEKIDHGKIIKQKIIEIEDGTTALDITHKGMILGIEAFKEFIGELLEKKIEGRDVLYLEDEPIYRSTSLPLNGVLKLPQPLETIVRVLRSYDYGGIEVIPKLKVQYQDVCYLLDKYHEERVTWQDMEKYTMKNGILKIKGGNREVNMFLKEL